MPHNLDCLSAALILWALHCCGSDLLAELSHFMTISCSSLLLCRRSTRWWALWSWWKWTKMAWRLSRGWTRSSPRWIRTTTTRSRWKSSKRRPRVTRPSYYCCSVTSRNRRVERSTSRHGLHRKLFHVPFSLQLFPLKTKQNKQKNDMLGLPFNGSASCVWNTCVHENVICYKKYTHLTKQCAGATVQLRTHTHTQQMHSQYIHTSPRTNNI